MKTEEKTKTNGEAPPTLSRAELLAADVAGEGGDQRQRRLQELDRIAKQREAEAENLTAVLAELSGTPEGKASIAEREARIQAADAERERALDLLAAERKSAELAFAEGITALRELGSPNPHREFGDSPQGRELAGRNSRISRTLEAAGQPGREPPEAVGKVLKSRALGRSQAHRAFLAQAVAVQKALGTTEAEAFAEVRKRAPELYDAAAKAPLVMPAPLAASSPSNVAKRADDSVAALRRDLNAAQLRNAIGWPGVSDHEARELVRKTAAAMTFDELMGAIMALGEEEKARVLEALQGLPVGGALASKRAAYKPCLPGSDAMCRAD